MPIDSSVFGFGNRFYRPGYEHAELIDLGDKVQIRVMPAPYAFATKVEAYRGRGRGDPWSSRDLEDLVFLLEGRAEMVGELQGSPDDVRQAVSAWAQELLSHPRIQDIIDGHVSLGPLHDQHTARCLKKLAQLALV